MKWYFSLSKESRRTFWACYLGFAFDAFDVMIYSLVVPTLMALWAMTKAEAGVIAAVTLLFSAIGGLAAGILADRIGRVKVLQMTILWYSVCTFLCAFATDPHQMTILRALQGLGFGGEWTAGSVLIGEVVERHYRGRVVGFVQSAWATGWGIAVLASTALLLMFPPEIAWRALFLMGLSPALLVIYIRRNIEESSIYKAVRIGFPKPETKPLFLRKHLGLIARGSLLASGIQGGYYAISTWMPTFLRGQRHLSIVGSTSYLTLIILGSLLGYIVSAAVTDRVGRRPTLAFFAIGSAAIILVYTHLMISNAEMLILSVPLGFFATGIFGPLGAFYSELFPTEIRATAQGFCYNFGRGVAAIFPFVIGFAARSLSLGSAIAIFASAAYGLVIIAVIMLPETRGTDLQGQDTTLRTIRTLARLGPKGPSPL